MMVCNADRVRRWLEDNDETAMIADGFDDAIIGLTMDKASGRFRVVYDVARALAILQNDHGMEYDDALEYFHVNVADAYVGDSTPVWCFLPEAEED
jgi:hypothetical protein